ncbi:DUF6519 domain-containing protein [Dyella subtropica]|uniref:DUF6519 domain-containing protein n=1 Tax=Dyella subtropica TaxID=2992127 RepID=UPI00224F2788|nr:DUF6519 domain-containing protein [Dyella subtropica]
MKGDFSRIRFEPAKHYTDVLSQQGRVALDADANEQRWIDDHRLMTETIDVIGPFGAPMHDPGFAIKVVGGSMLIGPGRYYVGGLLCDNAKPLEYDEQPYLIPSTASDTSHLLLDELLKSSPGTCLRVYLEVWQRLVTALDDPCLGEPALGQADTTARTQTVWRVVAQLATADTNAVQPYSYTTSLGKEPSCCPAMYRASELSHTGLLSAQTADGGGDCGCQPIPAAGYVGLENQLYRVEIHQSGDIDTATFKWSRENASVVVAILSMSGSKVTVSSLGMDANLGFREDQWVEISDDTNLFGETPNQPGALYQIQHVDQATATLTMTTTVNPVDLTRNPRLRRWEQTDTTATASGVALSEDWLSLENGIQVCFAKGHYVSGDAWTIPARSATGQIDWPPCGGDGNPYQPAHHAKIHRAPLACIHLNSEEYDANGALRKGSSIKHAYMKQYGKFQVEDCRRLFPSLTDLGGLVSAKALHITGINWDNDDVMTADQLMKQGLAVTFDHPPTGPVTPANFTVLVEAPYYYGYSKSAYHGTVVEQAPAADSKNNTVDTEQIHLYALMKSYATPKRVAVAREEVIVEAAITTAGNTLTWKLDEVPYLLKYLLDSGSTLGLRVRVKLSGRMLYASPLGGGQIYLDGQAFGVTADSSQGNATPRIDLRFPTGNQDKASDFESWFMLYPELLITNVELAYTELDVTPSGAGVTVTAHGGGVSVKQQATITLNYHAVEATTINLSLGGDPSVATVASSVPVNIGDNSVTVPIQIVGLPASGQSTVITLTASITNALGQASSQQATFTVYPQQPPPG